MSLGVGLLGLGTVGTGVAGILLNPEGRQPLVRQLQLRKIGVRNLNKPRAIPLPPGCLTDQLEAVVDDPTVDVVVEMLGGLEPARRLILRAIGMGKPVVTANKAVIAHHGVEINGAAAKAGVYVLMEAAVGGGIPIIEPLKQSLGANRIQRIIGIINGTTNYILTRMASEGAAFADVLADAQALGYAEADPTADVEGHDAADKITIMAGLAYGGLVQRQQVPTEGISHLQATDLAYANRLGYSLKLLATAARLGQDADGTQMLDVHVHPTLVPKDHPIAGVKGVNNAVLVEGEPVGQVMFYGPGAGSGPTASAVVADMLNIAAIREVAYGGHAGLDPLLAAVSWQQCRLADAQLTNHSNYVRLKVQDHPGVIGQVGACFGVEGVSIQSIIQVNSSPEEAEVVVVTQQGQEARFRRSLQALDRLDSVISVACCLRTL
ncbi:MAG: homoserine dehydrogenase [Candidatus Synechococcus spongiarum 142]|uniref:Homoserine dehydrogenase n=1 Tax=Candidatus Synechococcus spongiarum 142 TaxID=1608213 RepID=A0A6N3X771_9SYNE|nr:MAG: homoserine dehydrogenase [Candidatus Synechococcus spongiarum 142]